MNLMSCWKFFKFVNENFVSFLLFLLVVVVNMFELIDSYFLEDC